MFKPPLNSTRVLADLNRGSNSLNSISGEPGTGKSTKNKFYNSEEKIKR